jgi:hypothetical protein
MRPCVRACDESYGYYDTERTTEGAPTRKLFGRARSHTPFFICGFLRAEMFAAANESTALVISASAVPMPAPVVAAPALPIPVYVSISAAILSPTTAQKGTSRANRRQRLTI